MQAEQGRAHRNLEQFGHAGFRQHRRNRLLGARHPDAQVPENGQQRFGAQVFAAYVLADVVGHERGQVREWLALVAAHPHRALHQGASRQFKTRRHQGRRWNGIQFQQAHLGVHAHAGQVRHQDIDVGTVLRGRQLRVADGEGAAPLAALDQAFGFQHVERTPHGQPRHAVFGRQGVFARHGRVHGKTTRLQSLLQQ
ncbi:hypothetical protein D3C87_1414040 [compost metagenome]